MHYKCRHVQPRRPPPPRDHARVRTSCTRTNGPDLAPGPTRFPSSNKVLSCRRSQGVPDPATAPLRSSPIRRLVRVGTNITTIKVMEYSTVNTIVVLYLDRQVPNTVSSVHRGLTKRTRFFARSSDSRFSETAKRDPPSTPVTGPRYRLLPKLRESAVAAHRRAHAMPSLAPGFVASLSR